MKTKAFLLILLIIPFLSQYDDRYEQLLNETVSEEYCSNVISNITKLLEEGYIYLDFYKSPLKPKGDESYNINKLDLIQELEAINKTDRKFYDFVRDIYKIIRKTGDNHLAFNALTSPSLNLYLSTYYYTIPFKFEVIDQIDNNGNVTDTYLIIAKDNEEETSSQSNTNETETPRYIKYLNKKIISINDTDPFEFITNLFGDISIGHNPQIKYVYILESIQNINIRQYPFLKEELSNITLKFEDSENYTFSYYFNHGPRDNSFEKYFIKRLDKYIINNLPLPNIKTIYDEYQKENDPNYNPKRKMETIKWDYESLEGIIKCKIDEDNKKNVMYLSSFSPNNYYRYEEIMFKCLDAFYSNNYEIIIIESKNGGGYTGLCFPMTQYLRPKILGTVPNSQKDTDVNYEYFMTGDEILNPETCKPYDSREKLSRNTVDDYGNGVTHNRTKEIEFYSFYSKKFMEEKRRKYIETKNTKKPTEIIIFTDGFSFSCGSVLIKNMQVYGSAIVVGYRANKNITNKKDFDASQSNSAVQSFEGNKYITNLKSLGFQARITNMEQFDPNDKDEPKIPMEFKKYPVDELSDIHVKYSDDEYDRFISTAEKIFKKYNNDNQCNKDNNLLYYETDECDSKLNIDHGHGGYICNEDGIWDKNNCVLKYCDIGYILDITNQKCIEDPCENIEIVNITLNCNESLDYDIEPDKGYIFTIDNNNNDEDCSLYFYSKYENFFFRYEELALKPVENGTQFSNGTKIYSNMFLNNSEIVKISIKTTNNTNMTDEGDNNEEEPKNETTTNATTRYFRRKKNNGLSTAGIVLISIFVPIAVIGFLILAYVLTRKAARIPEIRSSNSYNSQIKF